MNDSVICLVWLDANWRNKGEAENQFLTIDYINRTYRISVTSYADTSPANTIEVKRVSDLKTYAQALKQRGFRQL